MKRKVEEDQERAEQQPLKDTGQDLAVLPSSEEIPQAPEVVQPAQPPQPVEGKKKDRQPLAPDELGWKRVPTLDELKLGDIRLTSYYPMALRLIRNSFWAGNADGLPDFHQADIVGINLEGKPIKTMHSNLRDAFEDMMDIHRSLSSLHANKGKSRRNHGR